MTKICSTPITTLTIKDIASFVGSILRILSTFIIYIFHCNAQYGLGSDRGLYYAFPFFLFISGYYSVIDKTSPKQWIIRRLKRIYIPYWVVICGVIIANFFFKYKNVGAREIFFLIIGGNLFIENKLYVISWFISLIIFLYICVYVLNFCTNLFIKISITIALIAILIKFNIPYYFFISFASGYILHNIFIKCDLESKKISFKRNNVEVFRMLAGLLRLVQNYSYEFFLMHGGILLFFTIVLHASYEIALYGGLGATLAGSIVLKFISNKIETLFSSFSILKFYKAS